jgi:hypothetical protein
MSTIVPARTLAETQRASYSEIGLAERLRSIDCKGKEMK